MLAAATPARRRRHRHRGVLARRGQHPSDDDDDDVENASPSDSDLAAVERSPAKQRGDRGAGQQMRRKKRCSFLDDAAGVDDDEGSEDGEDGEEGGEGSDCGGFVAYTQAMAQQTPQTDERAMYMRSLRTPDSEGAMGEALLARVLGRGRGR